MGMFEEIFQALSIDADFENISIDSTSCKVHQNANDGEKTENKAIGMFRGGRNTKIHTLVDGLGNPLAFMLPSGADHDSIHAVPLLQQLDIEGSNIRHGVKRCVSENRQSQGWRWGNSVDSGLELFLTTGPGRAGRYARLGVNAGLPGGTI